MLRLADLHESNHQLESRVREIRLPGSEGGALVTNVPTPIRLQRNPRSQARIGNSESVDQRDCIRADLGTERGDQSANCFRLKARHHAVLQVPAFMQLEVVERKKIA